MFSPYQHAMQKYMYDFLQERYGDCKDIVERTSNSVMTQQDLTNWVNMIAAVYEKGYMAASNQYNEELAKRGYGVRLEPTRRD